MSVFDICGRGQVSVTFVRCTVDCAGHIMSPRVVGVVCLKECVHLFICLLSNCYTSPCL